MLARRASSRLTFVEQGIHVHAFLCFFFVSFQVIFFSSLVYSGPTILVVSLVSPRRYSRLTNKMQLMDNERII